MATATKNTTVLTEADKKKRRSEAAKKAAQTRKLKKQRAIELEAEKQAAELELKKQAEEAKAIAPLKTCDVICEVLQLIRPGTEDSQRPEGYTYKECLAMVLERIRPTRPDAATSLDCLRWYATKLRGEGIILPYRPRNTPIKKDPTS